MKAIIYHNPRCSKSRGALQILQAANCEIEEVRYLQEPPSQNQLAELCKLMQIKPEKIVRKGEALFKELDLASKTDLTDQQWLEILHQYPKLIERPIVQINDKAVIGRPPERVLEIMPS